MGGVGMGVEYGVHSVEHVYRIGCVSHVCK